ncbi:MAG TPA: ABC transporter ATP-binding protein [bacterium]|nr:ABC transporter ATP-binding protein [bacterium]
MLQRLRLIFPYVKRYRRYFWWGLVAIIVTNALELLSPLVLRRAINRIEHGGDASLLIWDAALIVLLMLVSGLFRFMVRRTVIWASRKIEYDLRGDLFEHILKLDGTFFDRTPTGDIITRASSDIEQVRMMIGPGIMQGVNTLVVALVAMPLMFHLDWQLALWVLTPLPILAVVTNLLGGVAHKRLMAIQEMFSALSASVQESFAGIRVLRAFSREEDRSRRFVRDSKELFRLNMRLVAMYGAYMPLMTLLSSAAIVLVLIVGGRGVIDGRIDLGTLVAFSVYLGMLIWPMIALGWVVSLYQRGVVSLQRLGAILQTKSAIIEPAVPAVSRIERGPLEFRHLSFAYGAAPAADGAPEARGREWALYDISFVIHPGETVAIAGPTGSGKSTIAHLLWRRYPVPDHTLFLAGVDANAVPRALWRSRIAVVPQEAFLFSETLRANINLTGRVAGDDDTRRLAESAAFAKDVAEFPQGYETVVGERGITLSGGQKQRVTLARALAADADVLVLDDAFSAVDAQTEREITDRLAAQFGTRIIILITHRIATLARVDRILFLEEGRLVDAGSHDELVARGGAYARWVAREAIIEELERM